MSKGWEERAAYCLVCGASMQVRPAYGAERPACTQCDFVFFRATSTAAAAVISIGRKIVFVRRGIQPYLGAWGFPGGFQEYGESLEHTAVRETREETGLAVRVERVLHVGHAQDDPRKLVNVVVYLARPEHETEETVVGVLRAADDAMDVRLFDLDELPEDIAFHSNQTVLSQLLAEYPSGDIL